MAARETGFRRTTGYRAIGAPGFCVGLLLLLLGVLPSVAQAALSSVPDNDWVTNGPVYAMARSGNTIYLGGSFTEVGPRTGPAVTFSGGASTPDAGFPQVSGGHAEVHAAISDGSGGWYLGGNFTHVGGVARPGLAHVLSGGSVDPNFTPSLEVAHGGSAVALALSGSTLYVGGNFPSISGVARNGLAAVSTTDGSVQSFNPGGGSISALAVSGGTLYVGGSFSELSGQPRTDLAAFTTGSNSLTSWAPQVTGTGAQIKALAVSGTQVYLAGSFDHVGGQARSAFAAVDTSGSLSSWNPEASGCGTGYSLVATGTVVYAGGCFTHIGGQSRTGVAALDPTTAAATSWNPEASSASVVSTLAVSGADVYAAGSFTQIGGQARKDLAALDATTAEATSWNPNPNVAHNPIGGFLTEVNVVAASGSRILAGGSFSSVGGVARKDLAAIDTTTGEATAWNPSVTPAFPLFTVPVDAISVASGVVYVGGSFSSVGGQSRTDLAALDPTTGNATSWNPGATSVFPENGHVSALLATPSTVYAAGSFTTLAGRAQRYLGAVGTASGTATSWSPVVSAPSSATEHGASPIAVLALSGTTLYIGGDFNELGGQGRTGAGAVSTESGSPTAWDPVLKSPIPTESPSVSGLAVAGSTVYLAAGMIGLVAVDASTGAALPWHPQLGSGPLAAANGALYLGAGALDASSGLALAWNPQPGAAFYGPVSGSTVMASGNHVYLAGGFTTTDLAAASGFAAFTITGPINTGAPTITGTSAEGQTLSEHHGSWTGTPTSFAYQWLRCTIGCTPISGATGQTYTPTTADAGDTIEVQETATNVEAASDPVGSAATTAVFGPPANTAPPAITGTPSVGQTLSCSSGTWSNSPTEYRYAWLRDFEPIPGATVASYVVTGSDAGHGLSCEVTATNPAGSRQALAETVVIQGGGGGSGEGTGGGTGSGGSGSTSTGSSGGQTGGGAQTGQAGPSPSAVTAALAALLSPKGSAPTILSLLKTGGYSLSFNAPGAGVLTVQWTTVSAQASRHVTHKAKKVVVASGSQTFSAAGISTVKLRLTAAGRKLLKKNQTLRVIDQATFTPNVGAGQTKQVMLTIRPGKKTGHH